MVLRDTIDGMLSDDYVERFKAEFSQLHIRAEKLGKMLRDYEDGTLRFTPKCGAELLYHQLNTMREYELVLARRATIENISLK